MPVRSCWRFLLPPWKCFFCVAGWKCDVLGWLFGVRCTNPPRTFCGAGKVKFQSAVYSTDCCCCWYGRFRISLAGLFILRIISENFSSISLLSPRRSFGLWYFFHLPFESGYIPGFTLFRHRSFRSIVSCEWSTFSRLSIVLASIVLISAWFWRLVLLVVMQSMLLMAFCSHAYSVFRWRLFVCFCPFWRFAARLWLDEVVAKATNFWNKIVVRYYAVNYILFFVCFVLLRRCVRISTQLIRQC